MRPGRVGTRHASPFPPVYGGRKHGTCGTFQRGDVAMNTGAAGESLGSPLPLVFLWVGDALRMNNSSAACAAAVLARTSAVILERTSERLCASADEPATLARMAGSGTPGLQTFQAKRIGSTIRAIRTSI